MTGAIFYLCGALFAYGMVSRAGKADETILKGKGFGIFACCVVWPVLLGYIFMGTLIDQEKKEKEKDESGKADSPQAQAAHP